MKTMILLTFNSTNAAVKAEMLLLDAGIGVTVMPLPPSLRAGCGIALRAEKGSLDVALALLAEKNIHTEWVDLS